MLNKEEKKQETSNIISSNINQAGGDIVNNYNGLQAKDIVPILKELVSFQISQYADEAKITAQKRSDEFGQKLTEEVTKKVLDKIYRFNEPSIQFIMREAVLGYVKSGNNKQGEDLIDLLIERIKVEEHTTMQNIIDEAIKILPTLSTNALALLILLAYRNLNFNGYRQLLINWFKCVSPLLKVTPSIQPLDISYLEQCGCASGMPGISQHNKFEIKLLKENNLFFTHPVKGEKFDEFLNILGLNVDLNDGIQWSNSPQTLTALLTIFSFDIKRKIVNVNVTSKATLNTALQSPVFPIYKDKVEEAIKLFIPFSETEVRQKLIELDPNWEAVIILFNREDIRSLMPSVVGNYIACRQLTKLFGQKVDMNLFYHN